MDASTMLAIITIVALCLLWAIVRVRRRVKADDEAIAARLAELGARKEAEQRAFAANGGRDRRNRIDEFWRVPSEHIPHGRNLKVPPPTTAQTPRAVPSVTPKPIEETQ